MRSLRGEIFALLTLAVPLILASVARLNTTIDGGQGIIVPAPEFPDVLGAFQDFLYLLNLAIAALAVAIAYAIQHSRFGWALTAIRDSEDVAEGLGVPTFRSKMFAIAASGLIGGISGAAFAEQIGFVNVQAVFGLTIPLFVIVMSVLGGRTHWLGPVIGATFIVLVQDRLVVAGLEQWRLIIFGAVLVFVVVAAPEGLQARLRARPAVSLGAFVLAAVGSVLIGVSDELLDAVGVGAVGAAAVALWPGSRRPVSRRAVSVDASLQPAAAGEPAVHVEPGGAGRRVTRHGGAARRVHRVESLLRWGARSRRPHPDDLGGRARRAGGPERLRQDDTGQPPLWHVAVHAGSHPNRR